MINKLCICSTLCLLLSSCYIYRAYRSRNFYLKDLPKFTAQTVHKSTAPFYFPVKLNDTRFNSIQMYLDEQLANSQTYSFTVIRNDTIIYDKYFNGLSQQDIFPSFSVAKSFVSTLVQIAHQENYIKSFQEPITNYLPSLLKRDKRFCNITIQHLLDMRSGIRSNENYNSPFADVIKMGFRRNIQHQLNRLKIAKPPGKFEYISVNTQLLGMIVQAATGKKLYTYLQEKLWQPLGMEADATWLLDSKKHDNVKAFCCLNAVAHDFAKLGRLYLNNGNWNGKQILDSNWIKASVSSDSLYRYNGYRNQWWQASYGTMGFEDSLEAVHFVQSHQRTDMVFSFSIFPGAPKQFIINYPASDYEANGLLSQYIYVHPFLNVIIVRTGHDWNTKNTTEEGVFTYICQDLLKMNYRY